MERNKSNTYAKKLNQKIKERTELLKQNSELGKKRNLKILGQFLLVIIVFSIKNIIQK
ncbi:hypothetical protein [Flavobacterium acetivorans]|uniref:hypothetical protein n=1 Tax=Flavobacterium acetivorans TaxID=2893883 RepID=UPI003D17DEE3